jgi:antitoxin (DNA-binding transcriptional repressor) of toxin-antitoxin stability system
MTETVSESKFEPLALEYFRRIQETGEEIVITDHGKPVAKIVPFREEDGAAVNILSQLRGTLIRYEDPYVPVVLEDWAVLRLPAGMRRFYIA